MKNLTFTIIILSISTQAKCNKIISESQNISIVKAMLSIVREEDRCDVNIERLLEKLPKKIQRKLYVTLESHERNAKIKHYGKSFNHHFFLIGNTKKGIFVYDPEHTNEIQGKNWQKIAYSKEDINYCLTNEHTLDYLPQYRLIKSDHFLNNKQHLNNELTSPNRHPEKNLQNKLTNKSQSLSFYSFFKLLTDKKIKFKPNTIINPNSNLSNSEINEIRRSFT